MEYRTEKWKRSFTGRYRVGAIRELSNSQREISA